MSFLLPVLLVLHVLPAAFWFGATGVLSNLGIKGATLPLRGPQLGSSTAAIVFGAALWWLLHRGSWGPSEQVLAAGALAAILAAMIQQFVAWPAAKTAPARFAAAQRASAVLVILALVAMVIFRFVM
jgi:hypothetical protein